MNEFLKKAQISLVDFYLYVASGTLILVLLMLGLGSNGISAKGLFDVFGLGNNDGLSKIAVLLALGTMVGVLIIPVSFIFDKVLVLVTFADKIQAFSVDSSLVKVVSDDLEKRLANVEVGDESNLLEWTLFVIAEIRPEEAKDIQVEISKDTMIRNLGFGLFLLGAAKAVLEAALATPLMFLAASLLATSIYWYRAAKVTSDRILKSYIVLTNLDAFKGKGRR